MKIQCIPEQDKHSATLILTIPEPIVYILECTGFDALEPDPNGDPKPEPDIENFNATGEIKTQAGVSGNNLKIDAPEKFKLIGKIKPSVNHIGQLADIIVIFNWTAFDNNASLTIPVTVSTQVQLAENIEINLFEGTVINMAGVFEVEFGYRINDNESFIDKIATLEIKPNQPPTKIELAIKTGENNLIGTFSTIDSDSTDHFIYSLIDSNNYFKVRGNVLYTTDFMPQFEEIQVVSDLALENTYPLKVQTTDSSGANKIENFIIQITPVIKPPVIHLTRKSVLENYQGIVGRVWTDEPDYEFELSENEYFWLDDLDVLRLKQPLDFETNSSHEITINDINIFQIGVNNVLDVTVHGKIHDNIKDFITVTDLEEVSIQLIPDIEHQFGIEADILAVAIHEVDEQVNVFILDDDTWQNWDGFTLPKFTSLILAEQHELEIFESAPFTEGEIRVYVGYRLNNGQLIYDPKPVIIEIQ
ncbi:MAG: hypothetical protein IMF12_01440 [Proteobacteria bacterium]|nr:hypothetical protein [Pseudomonadota bacterium]